MADRPDQEHEVAYPDGMPSERVLWETIYLLRKFHAQAEMLKWVLAGVGGVLLSISAWTLTNVVDLKANVAVLQKTLDDSKEQMKGLREDEQRLRDLLIEKLSVVPSRQEETGKKR